MKKLFAILLVTLLTSCGGSSSSQPAEATEQSTALEPAKSKTDYKNIIGKPFKIGKIEVAQYYFPKKMNWEDAKKACADLGEGWKLPSKAELNYLYQNRVDYAGFANDLYWSSTEFGNDLAWYQGFTIGSQGIYAKTDTFYVRAIRALEQSAALELEQLAALEPPKSNTDYKTIIGKPIKMGNIEVAQFDFPEMMNWNDAKKACEALGDGWRLPSLDELNILYENQNKIRGFVDGLYFGGFRDSLYWSSTELDGDEAWGRGMGSGRKDYSYKTSAHDVRAIRAF